jgi:RNA polymerase sigma factor (sigma-70 family)
MSDRGHQLLYRAAHAAARRAGAVPDADLVRQLATHNDRGAFELLLWRHGPAVWGVCRRVLGPTPEAEDVFQAVFLALSRRAGTIGDGNAVPGWLHRVAVRAAVEAAKTRSRRTGRETSTPILPEAIAPDDPVRAAAGRELGAVLDAAIARLPDRYRLPFLLCEVYGRTPAAAAAELNCAVGTVASRLSRAKRRLRTVLARRGLALPASLAVAVLPAGLSAAALQSAFSSATSSAKLAALADRAAQPIRLGPWKMVAAACLVVVAGGFLARAQQKTPPADKPPPVATKKAEVEFGPVKDQLPLPDGAVARIGSTRLRHAGGIHDVAFSPDGKWVATAGADGVFVWDADTGERRFKFPALLDTQPQLKFMDGGKALWIFSPHGSHPPLRSDLRRFSLADGKELPEILPDAERQNLFGFGFDPAGQRWGYVHYTGTTHVFRVHDAVTGKQLASLSVPAQWSMRPAFAPGGKVIAFPPGEGTGLGAKMPVVEVETGKELVTIVDPDHEVGAATFAPDGHTLAAITVRPKDWESSVAVWDATTGQLVRRITGVEKTARCLSYSPDGKYLAVGNSQRMAVQLFEVATGKEVRRFRSWPSVMSVAFSTDGKRLAAARTTGTVSIWDVDTGKPTVASADPDAAVMELRFLDGNRLRAVSGDAVVYDWRTSKVLVRSIEPTGRTNERFAVSPDGRHLAMPDWPGVIRLHDARTGAEVKKLQGHTVLADPVVFSADGARLFSRGHDQTVRAWDVGTGKELFKVDFAHASSGDRLAVSPDGKRLAVSAQDGEQPIVQVRDAATGAEGPQLILPTGRVSQLVFSPDSTMLAAAGGRGWADVAAPGWIVLWDAATGTVRRSLTVPSGFPLALAFTPDGRVMLTGGMDGVVRVWELATGQVRRALKGHEIAAYTLAVSPDGRHVASASPEVPTLVWDLYVTTGGPLAEAEEKTILADLGADAAVGFTAVRRLVAGPAEAVALLRAKLQPTPAADPKQVQELVRALDADRFAVREKAAADLQKLGDEAEPALRSALAATTSAEARERLTQLLPKVADPSATRLRELRAVEALEQAGTLEAAALLGEWAKDSTLRISRDAAAARGRMESGRIGSPSPPRGGG